MVFMSIRINDKLKLVLNMLQHPFWSLFAFKEKCGQVVTIFDTVIVIHNDQCKYIRDRVYRDDVPSSFVRTSVPTSENSVTGDIHTDRTRVGSHD